MFAHFNGNIADGFKQSIGYEQVLRQLIERKQRELGDSFWAACENLGLKPQQIEGAKQGVTQGVESALATLLGIATEEVIQLAAIDRGHHNNNSQNNGIHR